MKLTITKKRIKNLSQDNKCLPVNMTKLINGGTITKLPGDSSDTTVTLQSAQIH